MNIIKYSFLAFFLIFCSNKKNPDCKDQGIKIEYLSDVNKLISNGYKCDNYFYDFGISELKRCKILFSDINYKILYNGYRTRLIFDKKENLRLAINSIAADFRVIKNRPYSLYVLDEKLMPVFAISKLGGSNFSVFKIEYKNNKIILQEAINKEGKNINVSNLKYSEILNLIKKIKFEFEYKKLDTTLDEYFYKVPFWTEGRE